MAVDLPFPFTAKTPQELIQQTMRYFEDIYQDRIGGAQLGDVFTIGDDEVLTVELSDSGGLEKSSKKIRIYNKSDGGLASSSSGEYIKCKTGGGLATDANGAYITSAGGSNFATINCPAGTDPVAEIVGDTLNLTATGLTITGNSTTDTVDFAVTDEAVTNAKLAHMAVNTIKGRITTGTGDPEDLTGANVRTIAGLATTDSPVFVNAKLSGLGDGKIPYHVDDATGFADGPVKTDVDDAVTKKHAIGGDTTLGAMAADINMNTHQLTTLSVPDANGEAIRATTKITEALLESATDLKHAAVTVSAPISLSGQALSLVNNAVSPATVTAIDIDGTLAGNSDTVIPSQKAVKTYSDTKTTLAAVKADADVASAISLKHTAGTDTALGAVGTKNPPIDADLAIYRDSTASNALVTSTWTQVKAFLKTYFDTLYNLYVHPNHSGEVTSAADGAQTIANDAVTYAKMQNVSDTDKVLGRSTAGAGDVEEIACTAFARSILDDANEATFKATVNLEIGTDVQAYDATLTSIALLGTAADKMLYATNVDTWAETAITAAGRAILDDATAGDQRTTLGVGTGDSPVFVTVKCSGLTDGYYSKHTSDATGLENGVLYQDAASRVIAGGTSIPANDMLGLNLMSHAKGQLIDAVYGIVTPANVRLFLIFDQTGAVSTITDRSTIGGTTAHVTTLRDAALGAINASTCTPGVSGLSPYITFDTTHLWDTPDAADLSFGDGSADSPLSIVVLGNLPDMTSNVLTDKWNSVTGSEQREYRFYLSSADKLFAYLYDNSASSRIGRYYNTALTAYENTWCTFAMMHGTGNTSADIDVGFNGALVDDTDYNTGSYTAMENLGATVGSYYINPSAAITDPFKGKMGVSLIVAEKLTAVQYARLDAVLRAYAGIAL